MKVKKRSRLCSLNVFFAMCCLATFGKGLTSSFLNSMVTTLERRFGFTGSDSGFLLGSNEFGYLATVLIGSYIASHLHLPRCISIAVFLLGLSFFLILIPFLLSIPEVQNASRNLTHAGNASVLALTSTLPNVPAQPPVKLVAKSAIEFCHNSSGVDNICLAEAPDDKRQAADSLAYKLFLVSRILAGASGSLITPLTLTYVDNNANRRYSPLYNGVFISMHPTGAILGYVAGSQLAKVNEYPWLPVVYDERDSRWIGAWWLGFAVAVCIELAVCIPIFFFPRHFNDADAPSTDKRPISHIGLSEDRLVGSQLLQKMKESADPSTDGESDSNDESKGLTRVMRKFMRTLWDILRNPVFLLLTFVNAMYGWLYKGYAAFTAKYMEYHFQMTTSQSALYVALSSASSTAGMVIGGLVVSCLKMSPGRMLKMAILVNIVNLLILMAMSLLSCAEPNMGSMQTDTCRCTPGRFYPVCNQATGLSYYSPCQAGCVLDHDRSPWTASINASDLLNCAAAKANETLATQLCPTGCETNFYTFNGLKMAFEFLSSSSTGSLITILFRYVRQEQATRTISFSTQYTLSTFLAWLPAPIVTGLLFDSACLYFESGCNSKETCRLFNRLQLRWRLHIVALVANGAIVIAQVLLMPLISWKDKIRRERDNQKLVA